MPKDRKAKAKKEQQKKQKALLQQKEYNRRRDEYVSTLAQLSAQLGLKEWFSGFSDAELTACFMMRISSLVYRQVGEHPLPKNIEADIREFLPLNLKETLFDYPNGTKVSAHHIVHYLDKLALLSCSRQRDLSEHYLTHQAKVDEFIDFVDEKLEQVEEKIKMCLHALSMVLSIPDDRFVIFSLDYDISKTKGKRPLSASHTSQFCIGYEVVPALSRTFTVEGNRRTGFLYAFPLFDSSEIRAINLPARLFGIPGTERLEVYIQSHALSRFVERIDSVDFNIAFFACTIKQLENPSVKRIGSNKFLIDVVVHDLKLGYFVACLADGVVLIKTFLFVTSSSTPEGRKLDTLTGLKKLDKQFLGIDKLSTYMALDVNKSPELVSIFKETGLEELLLIDKKKFSALLTPLLGVRMPENSELITSYIKRRTTELSLSQVEEEEGEIALR
jgi:hypothetical protein